MEEYGASPVTRREADQIWREIRDVSSRLELIDRQGTRGMGVTEAKLMDVVGDLAEFKAALAAHAAQHEHDERERAKETRRLAHDRIVTRRWLIGIGFTAAGTVIAILALLASILGKVHGG